MNISKLLKSTAMLLAVSLAVGCAGTPEGGDAEAAISAAKAANARAKAENYEWRDTGKLIKDAEKALADGDSAKAIKLANKAQKQAEMAVKQKYAEIERLGFDKQTNGGGAASSYEVVRGDNLWNIAGKASIYGNPFQWPLIFKANSGKIKDADLIYPGQSLDIDTNPSDSDVAAAVQHAKTRGSWSIGATEDSDKAYLGK